MNLEYKYLLDGSFHPHSKVWVYQASRRFTMGESLQIEDLMKNFVSNWQSHGASVKGGAYLFFGQFIVLIADESDTHVGGCSTDSSVRMVKEIERIFAVSMFDRTTLAFIVRDKLELLPVSQLQYAMDNGFINPDTLYFNNLVPTFEELKEKWIVPVKESWIMGRVTVPDNASTQTSRI